MYRMTNVSTTSTGWWLTTAATSRYGSYPASTRDTNHRAGVRGVFGRLTLGGAARSHFHTRIRSWTEFQAHANHKLADFNAARGGSITKMLRKRVTFHAPGETQEFM